MRTIGTAAFGLRCPIFKQGDNVESIVSDIVLNAGIEIKDKDVLAITEAVMGRTQGNYATIDDIADSVKSITNNAESICIVNPIFSRNRFSMILKGIARAAGKKIVLVLPKIDEVGNVLKKHPFTGMNYDVFYSEIITNEHKEIDIVYVDYIDENMNLQNVHADCFIAADIHTRENTKRLLSVIGKPVFDLTSICHDKCEYGLLGSNKATEEKVKLFPTKDYCQNIINSIQKNIFEATGKHIEVMIYGDGCFKDPVGGIWEFADPVVSPAFTDGLQGTPNEIKLKYLADNQFADLSGETLADAIKQNILSKEKNLVGNMVSQGTTPRQITDLLGSLCDLISGSGDKGTPVVYIQGYFDNYATE